ncbi:hypothetical protein NI389_13790 [Pseudoalteromonas xiamenensis]|uniref:hypothetical protein n=1 Tax=Pseudoalteromonas xiamenensis TaxID=882626 RepID=UPI0027E55FEF|nr:hypothetical protein [Pseudoalteromonas xiamenensis]WMN59272.1 hypothetical protein NI389_13790 [Pseudoalteromonas xiamenensis]
MNQKQVFLYDENRQFVGSKFIAESEKLIQSTDVPPPELGENEVAVYAGNGRWIKRENTTQKIVTVKLTKPEVQSLTIDDTIRVGLGGIVWLPINQPFSIKTTAVGIPDSQLMVMIERVVDGSKAVDDVRVLAEIKDGKVTIDGVFKVSGNYLLRASRLNEGLERIKAPFRLMFDTVEFDAYEDLNVS